MMNDFDNIIGLTNEAGEEIPFEFLDLITYQGNEYVVLLPVNASADEAGEVVILLLESSEDSDTEYYSSVDDQDTLVAVFELFKEKYKDEFDFTD